MRCVFASMSQAKGRERRRPNEVRGAAVMTTQAQILTCKSNAQSCLLRGRSEVAAASTISVLATGSTRKTDRTGCAPPFHCHVRTHVCCITRLPARPLPPRLSAVSTHLWVHQSRTAAPFAVTLENCTSASGWRQAVRLQSA